LIFSSCASVSGVESGIFGEVAGDAVGVDVAGLGLAGVVCFDVGDVAGLALAGLVGFEVGSVGDFSVAALGAAETDVLVFVEVAEIFGVGVFVLAAVAGFGRASV
jgi:hypothetical protein